MNAELTYLMPRFLAPLYQNQDAKGKEQFLEVSSFITYLYTRYNGKKDKKLIISSKALQRRAPQYRSILDALKGAGFFNYISNYKAPQNGEKGYCRFFLMGNKFLKAIRGKDWIKFKRVKSLRAKTKESESAIQERVKESAFLDDIAKHVSNSLNEFSLDEDNFKSQCAQNAYDPGTIDQFRRIQKGDMGCKRSEKVGKIVHNVCSLPRELRKGTLRGESTVEMDLKSSHPFIIYHKNYIVDRGTRALWKQFLYSGDFWTSLKDHLGIEGDRSTFKIDFFRALSTHPAKDVADLRRKIFFTFPDLILNLTHLMKTTGQTIQAILQKDEAERIDSFIDTCRKRDIPIIPVYDSFIVRERDTPFVMEYWGSDRVTIK